MKGNILFFIELSFSDRIEYMSYSRDPRLSLTTTCLSVAFWEWHCSCRSALWFVSRLTLQFLLGQKVTSSALHHTHNKSMQGRIRVKILTNRGIQGQSLPAWCPFFLHVNSMCLICEKLLRNFFMHCVDCALLTPVSHHHCGKLCPFVFFSVPIKIRLS